MTTDLSPDALAATHRAAFGLQPGWRAADFSGYLSDPTALIIGTHDCFVLVRIAGPEAEILTLASHPDVQRQGRATKLLRDCMRRLEIAGIEDVFLDVSDQNAAARALYDRSGFIEFARRKNYYANGATALCMKAELSPT